MPQTQDPAPGQVQGLGFGMVLPTRSNFQDTLSALPKQDAVAWLARRARLSLAVASAVATANGWGAA